MSEKKDMTLKELQATYLTQFATPEQERTRYRYGIDSQIFVDFIGGDKLVRNILPARVALFLKCDALLKDKRGKQKSQVTIDRTVRVMKSMLRLAVEIGVIDKLPLPKELQKPEKAAAA